MTPEMTRYGGYHTKVRVWAPLRIAVLMATTGLAGVWSAAAYADDEQTTSLGAITVWAEDGFGPVEGYAATRSGTGTKTDTPIIATPQSISIVTADQIETQKPTSVTEALSYSPGIAPAPGYSNNYDVFYSRGFRLQAGNGSILRDGLRMGGLDGWATGKQEPYGLERVELLKGASSVLFGSVSPGGVLNTVTKRPQPEAFSEVVIESGTHDHMAVSGDVNIPLSDRLAFRFVGLARNSDTWVDYTPNDTYYFSPSLTWTPSDRTSLTVMAHAQRSNSGYIHPLPIEGTLMPSPFGKLPRSRFVGEPDWDKAELKQTSFSYQLTHDFSDDLKLRHGARYLDSKNDTRFVLLMGQNATTPTAQDRLAVQNDLTTVGFSTDTSLEYSFDSGSVRHTLLGGVDYSHYNSTDVWWLGALDPIDLNNPDYGQSSIGPLSFYKDRDGGKVSQLGIYAQDQIEIDDLTLLLGGRYDWADVTPIHKEKDSTDAFTGRAGLVYRFDNGMAPFLSFSQSFEPQLGIDATTNERFKPTEGSQYEAGLRWQNPGETFMVTGSVYELTQSNVLSENPNTGDQFQTGEVRARGFELEARGEIAPDWAIIAAYAYTDAKVTKDEDPSLLGMRFDEVPRHSASLWLERSNLGTPGLTLGGGVRFVGDTPNWGGAANVTVPSFTLVDANISYELDSWRAALNAKNILDADALQCSYDSCSYGDGRRVEVSLTRRW